MASTSTPSTNSASPLSSSAPTRLPDNQTLSLADLQRQKDIKELSQWVKSEYEKARQARSQRQLQWYTNMAYFYGKQWVEQTRSNLPQGYADKLYNPRKPYYQDRKTINRTRSLVRSELSRFLTQLPSIQSVPATAEDQDLRAAYAAEQAWESLRSSGKLEAHFARAVWWMVVTGTGFLKTWWDNEAIDKVSGQPGVIRFGSVSPFNLFVPNLRETEIEDQPFIINAYVKPVQWIKQFFGDQLKGVDIQPSVQSANMLVDDGHLNLSGGNSAPTSCIVYETWIKPGGHPMFPQGGLVIQVDDNIVSMTETFPYAHGMYPFAKVEHIPTATFYGDSPLVDTNPLQKEYNILRSQISEAGKRMGKPQLLAQKGSITPSKLTNEPGLVIEYKAGFQPPSPMPLSPLPQYLIDQQDRILTDFEDISGQHEVSNGTAPTGVTAGTAINYLQEANDRYFTPQYDSIEQGFENIATQAIELFVQYVDMPRKIKTIGADEAFDTVLLSGSDIASGTDIRVEKGSGVAESKAGKEARVMDMFSVGLIPQEMALKLLEVGGAQKILDVVSVAERKAQRENIKMKLLQPQDIAAHLNQIEQEVNAGLTDPSTMQPDPNNPNTVLAPPMVPVADFDIHAIHIDTHNKFRMGQEYETLSPEVQDQFDRHVKAHEAMLQQKQQQDMVQQLMAQAGGGGQNPDPNAAPVDPNAPAPDAGAAPVPDATMPADAGAPGAPQGV